MTATVNAPTTTQMYRVYIKATPQAIWDAITKPEWTEQYGYGGRVEFDLRSGGAFRMLSTKAMRDSGAPGVMVDGEIIESDPPRRLVQTWRLIMSSEPEGFTRLTYEIEEGVGGVSKLTLTHELEGAPHLAIMVSGGHEKYGAGGGWNWVLSSLKTVLETGTSLQWQGGSQRPDGKV